MTNGVPFGQPSTVKPKRKQPQLVPVGIAYSWWCMMCQGFCLTFFEDVLLGEATCDHCSNKAKLNLIDPGTVTPQMPKRKPVREVGGIREVHMEVARGGLHAGE